MLVHVRKDARRGLEMHKMKAADVGSLKQCSLHAGGTANSSSMVALRDAARSSSRVGTGSTRACGRCVPRDALQQLAVSGCPGQESYLQGMGCLHTISLWPSTYHLLGFIKAFSLDFWLPQEPGAWFWGANSHQRP